MAGAARRAEAVRFGRFISRDSGDFHLTAGADSWSGRYVFDRATGDVVDRCLGDVGTFSCDPISRPFRRGVDVADASLPCATMMESDVSTEIQKPENAGAYFVLPSQLNGTEYPAHETIVERLEEYKYDNTSGPCGQLAVHPAIGQFLLDNAARDGREHGISAVDLLLEKISTPSFPFRLRNGYLQMPLPETPADCGQVLEALVANLHLLRLLVMAGVPASGLTPDKRGFSGMVHRVSLVYASAVPLESCVNHAGGNWEALDLHKQIAEAMLSAQYYGALQTAARGTQDGRVGRIFLTPMGAGVFKNSLESIAGAISLAMEMLTEGERRKLDIRVLALSGKPRQVHALRELLDARRKLLTPLPVSRGLGDQHDDTPEDVPGATLPTAITPLDSTPAALPPTEVLAGDAARSDAFGGHADLDSCDGCGTLSKARLQMASEPGLYDNLVLAISLDWRRLADCPDVLRADRPVVLDAIRRSSGEALRFAAPELRADRDIVLEAVRLSAFTLKYAADEIRSNRELMMKVCANDGNALRYVAEELKDDYEVVLAAVKQHGPALVYASHRLVGDLDLLFASTAKDMGVAARESRALPEYAAAPFPEFRAEEATGTWPLATQKPTQAKPRSDYDVLLESFGDLGKELDSMKAGVEARERKFDFLKEFC